MVDKDRLKSDLCKLADQALPTELSSVRMGYVIVYHQAHKFKTWLFVVYFKVFFFHR